MNAERKKLVSLVVPVFNEAENIVPLYREAASIMDELSGAYDFELIFTDNHSDDGTFEKAAQLVKGDDRVRVFRFSRNFGYQRSILTGLLRARGDAVIQLDCDLQDPPRLIVDFIKAWEDGHEVVYGVRRRRREGAATTFARKAFYRMVNWLSEDELPLDAGDFRLVDRKIVEALRQTDDCQPYIRGAIAAMGFDQVGIPYDRPMRERGRSKFSLLELFGLAMDGILNHSIIPLRVATFFGLTVSAGTIIATAFYLVAKIVFHADWPAGFATTTILILFSLSMNALFLGIIGEYLGRIYKQVKRKPLTIVEASLGKGADGEGGGAREAGTDGAPSEEAAR